MVEFEGERFLEVSPHESYEAWQIASSIGFMMVCSPGGSVSVFRGPQVKASLK